MLRVRNKWLNLENIELRDCNVKCERVENGMEQSERKASDDSPVFDTLDPLEILIDRT